MAPTTGESGNAVIGLDPLAALGASSIAVALHPVVQQIASALGLLRLDVGGDAGSGGMLHTALVDRILADYPGRKEVKYVIIMPKELARCVTFSWPVDGPF